MHRDKLYIAEDNKGVIVESRRILELTMFRYLMNDDLKSTHFLFSQKKGNQNGRY